MEECGSRRQHGTIIYVAGQLCGLQRACGGNTEGQQSPAADRDSTGEPGCGGVWCAVGDGPEDLRHAEGGADPEGGIHLYGKRKRYG